MGVSMITAITVATSQTQVTVFGPCETTEGPNTKGKYAGAICHGNEHEHHPGLPILSTPFLYDSEADAKKAMEDAILSIKDHYEKEFK